MPLCRGSFRALLLYDIAEEFDLDELGRLIGAQPPKRSPGFKLPVPGYVRFERPPLQETSEPIHLATVGLKPVKWNSAASTGSATVWPACNRRCVSRMPNGSMRLTTLSI